MGLSRMGQAGCAFTTGGTPHVPPGPPRARRGAASSLARSTLLLHAAAPAHSTARADLPSASEAEAVTRQLVKPRRGCGSLR